MRAAPRAGGMHRTFTITWASADAAGDHVYDVRVRRPGKPWKLWRSGAKGSAPKRIVRPYAFVLSLAALALAGHSVQPLAAQGPTHGIAMHGQVKYPPDFPHFSYVNPDAPKGGRVRLSSVGNFDSFNPILPKGEVAGGIGLLYETLMTPSADEIGTYYGQCSEICGTGHAYMPIKVQIVSKEDFGAWTLAMQKEQGIEVATETPTAPQDTGGAQAAEPAPAADTAETETQEQPDNSEDQE